MFVSLLTLLFALYFIIQLPAVQRWGIGKLTDFFRKEWQTDVAIDKFRLSFSEMLVLEGVYIADRQGDTLLYAGELRAGFGANILSLLDNELNLNSIYLKDTHIHLKRESSDFNFQFIIDYFASDTPDTTAARPFRLEVDQLFLERVHFEMDDRWQGTEISAELPVGEFRFDDVDFTETAFSLQSVYLGKPSIRMYLRPGLRPDLTGTEPGAEEQVAEEDSTSAGPAFLIRADKFRITGGTMDYRNMRHYPERTAPANAIDYNFIRLDDLDIDLEAVQVADLDADAVICGIRFRTDAGFELRHLQAQEFHMDERSIALNQFALRTPTSSFGDTLSFKFRSMADFNDFTERVLMEGRMKNSYLSMEDLFYFAPGLRENSFFTNHFDKVVNLSGIVRGRVNNLRGDNLDITIAGRTQFTGSFSSRNLTTPSETILNLDIENLHTDIVSLKQMIPGLRLPENFNKLGRIQFTGRFDGFYQDFVAYGVMQTNLGKVTTDLQLNTLEGVQKARYRGKLALDNFNLRAWTEDPDLGNLTLAAEVTNGTGMTLETVRANLFANIQSLSYKGYSYENVRFRGNINKNLVDGNILIEDDNIDLVFDGTIDYLSEYPTFDFTSRINKLDLHALNLMNKPFALAGDLDLNVQFKNISNIEGFATLQNLVLSKPGTAPLLIDSIHIDSRFIGVPEKTFSLNSDLVDLDLGGQFDFQHIWPTLVEILEEKHGRFAEALGIRGDFRDVPSNDFRFDLILKDSRNAFELLDIPLEPLQDVLLRGEFSNKDSTNFKYRITELSIPRLRMPGYEIDTLRLFAEGDGEGSRAIIHFDRGVAGGVDIEPLDALVTLQKDTLNFNIGSDRVLKGFEDLNINGRFFLVEDRFHVEFSNLEFVGLDTRWKIQESNFIQFSKDYIYARNLRFSDGRGIVAFSTIDSKGIQILGNDIDLALLNKSLEPAGIDLKGDARFEFTVGDLFKLEDIRGNMTLSRFRFNDILLDNLQTRLAWKDLKSPINLDLQTGSTGSTASANGIVILPQSGDDDPGLVYNMKASLDGFPLAAATFFLGNMISETEGKVYGDLTVKGKNKLEDINGNLRITDAATKLDYLGTRYFIRDAPIRITRDFIDLDNIELEDELKNKALVKGGISHKLFEDFNMNLRISSPRFQVLNTRKEDNELFYGKAQGRIDVRINGSFDATDLYVNAETGPQTTIAIPLSNAKEAKEQNFIVFINREDGTEAKKELQTLKGLSLQIDFTITPVAELQLIFDERTGDIIKGSGNGNIQLELPRNGEFQMFGDFEIEKGEYPFRALGVVDKAFSVKRGGTIVWYGDPLNAYIDLEAEYKGLKTSPYNLILEYIVNDPSLLNEARKPTDVDLTLQLSGQLLQPNIQFDIQLPTLQGELKNYADNKLRIVSSDQNEMNKLAFGLLAIRAFLPQNSDLLSASAVSSTLSSTLTEWFTNQMRVFVNEYVIDSLGGNSIVTDVDLDFGIILNPNFEERDIQQLAQLGQSQFYIKPRFSLFDDRLTIDLGINTYGSLQSESNLLFAQDINIEYAIGESRRMRTRVYNNDQPLINGRRSVFGAGLVYRREYEEFSDIFKSNRRKKKKEEDKEQQQQPVRKEEEENVQPLGDGK